VICTQIRDCSLTPALATVIWYAVHLQLISIDGARVPCWMRTYHHCFVISTVIWPGDIVISTGLRLVRHGRVAQLPEHGRQCQLGRLPPARRVLPVSVVFASDPRVLLGSCHLRACSFCGAERRAACARASSVVRVHVPPSPPFSWCFRFCAQRPLLPGAADRDHVGRGQHQRRRHLLEGHAGIVSAAALRFRMPP
jgi:hypothetical protein